MLFNAVEEWRLATSVTRFELTVMLHNVRAICLYKAAWFLEEGIRHRALKVDGLYVDEYYMAKTFD